MDIIGYIHSSVTPLMIGRVLEMEMKIPTDIIEQREYICLRFHYVNKERSIYYIKIEGILEDLPEILHTSLVCLVWKTELDDVGLLTNLIKKFGGYLEVLGENRRLFGIRKE